MGVPGTSCAYGPRPQVRGSHSLLNAMHLLNLRQMSGELPIAHVHRILHLCLPLWLWKGLREMLAQAFASYDRQRSVF